MLIAAYPLKGHLIKCRLDLEPGLSEKTCYKVRGLGGYARRPSTCEGFKLTGGRVGSLPLTSTHALEIALETINLGLMR